MKFTITRKNTNDKFIVSSINDSKKSSKLSRAKISDAEIYKCRIIRFLDAVAATNESEKAGLSPEQLKKLSLSSKANTVANVLVEHKDEFSETNNFKELKDLFLWVLNQPNIKNQPNTKKHLFNVQRLVDKYGEYPTGAFATKAYTDLMKLIWNIINKADGLESPDSKANRASHGVTKDSMINDADKDTNEESLSKEDIKALKDLVKAIPELLALLKKSDKEEDKEDKKEDKEDKEEDKEESVLLESSDTDELDENTEEDIEEDDEIIADEDITEDLDESSMHDSAVSIGSHNSNDDDFSAENEICEYFNEYYKAQLKK